MASSNISQDHKKATTTTREKRRRKWLQSMPKNCVDQYRLFVYAIDHFIREMGRLSFAVEDKGQEDPYLKLHIQKLLFDMNAKKLEFYRDAPSVVKLMEFLENRGNNLL